MPETAFKMKVRIDLEKCCNSGECYYNHPELFAMGAQGESVVKRVDLDSPALRRHAQQAAEVCPTAAILVED